MDVRWSLMNNSFIKNLHPEIFRIIPLVGLTTLSFDTFLPAMESIADDLGGDITKVKMSVGVFFVACGLGRAFGGGK